MFTDLQILKWSETFESAKTRKLQRLQFFHHPTGSDSRGYRKLARLGADGFLALGVFDALCQAMATLRVEARKSGQFLNSDGSGMEMADVWEIARIPEGVGTRALPILKELGWVEYREDNGRGMADHPPASDPPPASLQGEERRGGDKEGRGEDEEGSDESPSAPAAVRSDAEKLVSACPRPSYTGPVLSAATRCLKRHQGALTFDEILEQTRSVTKRIRAEWSDAEKLDFIPNAERFFAEDLFRRHPDEWRSKKKGRPSRPPVETGGRKFEVLEIPDQ